MLMRLAVFSLLIIFELSRCSRILMVFPMMGKSHYILGNALGKGLAEAGHDVTLVGPFEDKKPPKNGKYREVLLTGFNGFESRYAVDNPEPFPTLLALETKNTFMMIPLLNAVGTEMTQNTFDHPNFQKLLKSKEKFDAVIMDQSNNDALKVLAHHYKAPLIMFSSIGPNSWLSPLVGNPSPPSYIPDFFLSYTENMTFCQRLVNFLFVVLSELNRQLIFFPAQDKMMRKYFPEAPDFGEINRNISLCLLNSHESVNQAVPHVPSMIDIGGFHVSPPEELPADLKYFMDSAEEGVVYFSMGSNIKTSEITEQQRQVLLRVFSKLKQKVLWKWDDDSFEGKPDNVKLSAWFPQSDVLAHPNTKVFITHGGLLSTIETIYHSVPILAFPIFADQKMNAAKAEMDGYGLVLKFSEIDEKKLIEALDKLLNDPKYRNNAQRRSKLLHDRPIPPMSLAVYWIEFVIRNKGAPHLRVAGVGLPWYIYLSLDAILFILLTGFSLLTLTYLLARRLLNRRSVSTKAKVKKH